jgi:hypothetical protein
VESISTNDWLEVSSLDLKCTRIGVKYILPVTDELFKNRLPRGRVVYSEFTCSSHGGLDITVRDSLGSVFGSDLSRNWAFRFQERPIFVWEGEELGSSNPECIVAPRFNNQSFTVIGVGQAVLRRLERHFAKHH